MHKDEQPVASYPVADQVDRRPVLVESRSNIGDWGMQIAEGAADGSDAVHATAGDATAHAFTRSNFVQVAAAETGFLWMDPANDAAADDARGFRTEMLGEGGVEEEAGRTVIIVRQLADEPVATTRRKGADMARAQGRSK